MKKKIRKAYHIKDKKKLLKAVSKENLLDIGQNKYLLVNFSRIYSIILSSWADLQKLSSCYLKLH